ncbi:MAG: beta-propeller domain-containing protein [Verrucomicrobiota bacterium]
MFKSRLFYPMVWPVQTLWMLGLALALVCAAVSCPAAMTGKPSILSIGVEQNELVVTIAVPAGAKRITLQSTRRLGQGGWIPRAVRLIEEPVESVTLRLAMSEELEILRVRAEDKQGLPASFFKGTNAFAGVANPGGAVDVRAFDGLGLPPPSVPVAVAPDAPNARAVVESDIWKVEQDTLYFFNQFRGLQVIDLSNPDSPVITGTLNLPAAGEQMYLLPGRQVVLLARSLCNWNGRSDSQVVIANANFPNPQILAELAVPGQIRESRMVGSALYVVSQAYKQRPNSDDWEWGTAITSFDLSNPALPSAKESLWFSGSTSAITASDRFLFVASNSWAQRPQTRVQIVDISDPTGVLRPAAVLMIAGTVQDKFKMNLNGDVFSVIAEEWNSETGRPVTRLRTFSLANPDAPAALGEVEVGHGERLFATRFDGTKVYIVTFLRIDPLWVVDLSDPKNPTVRGELEIPGWSTYIQPMGDRLLTIGIDNVNGWRVAVSLFNVSNPAAPALLSKVPLGDNHSWSEATHDEKAFGVLPDLGMLLVPVSAYSTNYQQGVQILDFTRDTLTKRGFITQQMVPRRATALQNRVLSISSRELMTVDVTDRDRPVTTSKLELSWRVDRVLGQGDFLLEIGGNAYDNAAPAIRVARKTDPATIVGGITLTNLYLIGSELRGDRLYILQRSHPNYWFVPVSPNNGPQTNSPILKLSVLDLSRLPAITLEGSVETATDDRIASQMTGHWMDSGALVWTPKQNDYWGYDWYRGPMPLMIDSAWGMPAFWYWNPDPTFYAFAVNQPSAPRFLSRVDFSENKDWSNFSAAWPVENLLYLSHQTYERVVTGTNRHLYTNYVWVTVTNIFPQTNVDVYTV